MPLPKKISTKIYWMLTALAPAAGKILILLALSKYGVDNSNFAILLNTSSLVGVFATASIGIALTSNLKVNYLGLSYSLAPLLFFGFFYIDHYWELLYIFCFSSQQIYRFKKFGDGSPLKALLSDLTFIIAHAIAIVTLEFSIKNISIILAATTIPQILSLSLSIRSKANKDPDTSKRYLYSGISNLSSSGLIFALPLIMSSMVGNQYAADATIVGTIAFITSAIPRAYVSSQIKLAANLDSLESIIIANKKLRVISALSFIVGATFVFGYDLVKTNIFLFLYGIAVCLYTAIGQASSLNANILMLKGDAGWLLKWNILISATVATYFSIFINGSKLEFIIGTLLISLLYAARLTGIKEKAYDRSLYK